MTRFLDQLPLTRLGWHSIIGWVRFMSLEMNVSQMLMLTEERFRHLKAPNFLQGSSLEGMLAC